MSTIEKNNENHEISQFCLPAYSEIPDVGLYLKQVVKYINETFGPWLDLTVTETMISNYVKMHLVPNAIKKQYYRDQIASFLFIVLAKPVVSLEHIRTLLKIREEQYETREAYELFAGSFMSTFRSVFSAEGEREAEPSDTYQLLMKNIIIAIVQKYYIEQCFRELEESLSEGQQEEAK